MRRLALIGVAVALTACAAKEAPPAASPAVASPPNSSQPEPGFMSFSALGTEPFWAITTSEKELTYSTPDLPEGVRLTAGWGLYSDTVDGPASHKVLSFVARLNGEVLILEIKPGACSDGMSDTVYPYSAKLRIGQRTENGCARKL